MRGIDQVTHTSTGTHVDHGWSTDTLQVYPTPRSKTLEGQATEPAIERVKKDIPLNIDDIERAIRVMGVTTPITDIKSIEMHPDRVEVTRIISEKHGVFIKGFAVDVYPVSFVSSQKYFWEGK